VSAADRSESARRRPARRAAVVLLRRAGGSSRAAAPPSFRLAELVWDDFLPNIKYLIFQAIKYQIAAKRTDRNPYPLFGQKFAEKAKNDRNSSESRYKQRNSPRAHDTR
jgi:hypothetical protein